MCVCVCVCVCVVSSALCAPHKIVLVMLYVCNIHSLITFDAIMAFVTKHSGPLGCTLWVVFVVLLLLSRLNS